jgi:signal transduction histidine kinase
LHDELGGLLTAAKLDLARMRSRLVQAGPELTERAAHLHATLDAGIALKRRIIEDLRPSSLENLGLGPALQILCDEWSTGSEIPVDLDVEEIKLAPATELVIYRLVQEALTNIAKYAQAHRVGVRLATVGAQALVQVSDDGCGFATTQLTPGHGLAGMRFRVAAIRGQLTVESAPGQGTAIRVRLPLDD